jgi:nucleotide-binding universal stress UspA family protein
MSMFKRILVATDFSETSRRAVDLAAAMARESGAEFVVVHVSELPMYGDIGYPVDLVTSLAEAAKVRLDELVASLREATPGAKGVVRAGVPWEQILAAAAELHADVIVLGTHGRHGFAHALIGSVAERIVRLAELPVLTVRGSEVARPSATST